ncbi:MAG: alpha/beta hydrolase [Coriobacteriia bacterium]|nr:alpha/beta hydrolase [Coriobacteriia bacterium]
MSGYENYYYPSVVRNVSVAGYVWGLDEERKPAAIVQISHGMAEHMARYDGFARFLNRHGILVVGKDHVGHGLTAPELADCGYFGPINYQNILIADMHTQQKEMQARYPGVPYFLFGHSMGSFLVREYITIYGKELSGAVICGSGDTSKVAISGARALVDILALVRGQRYRSSFINNLMFGSFNKRIENPRTKFDWLSRDEKIVDAYIADEKCGFLFTLNGFAHMLLNIARVSLPQAFDETPKSLPLLLISGGQDPTGDYGRALDSLMKKYKRAGLADVEGKLYPEDRHELLNELNAEVVMSDIVSWIERHCDE